MESSLKRWNTDAISTSFSFSFTISKIEDEVGRNAVRRDDQAVLSLTGDFLFKKIIQFVFSLDGFTGGLGRGRKGDDDDAHVVTTPLRFKYLQCSTRGTEGRISLTLGRQVSMTSLAMSSRSSVILILAATNWQMSSFDMTSQTPSHARTRNSSSSRRRSFR